ncbi:MAG: family 43 glycosylhydrolase [Saprospiraceae bacterium]|nr:family 43 glycosylhydrolase [Saprospiraceae bacterium]
MYAGAGYSEWEIGDIDVFQHDGIYHLFHLIIPNHDYIAHAISNDGVSWKRVNNALFVGHPGAWDDDMLWTMHAAEYQDKFYLFYTGLSLKDKGSMQKIGIAVSDDLMEWTKVTDERFPARSQAPYYEDLKNNPRQWLSFRDPFYYTENGRHFLFVCARASEGPFSRRGCVATLELFEDKLVSLPPILYPRMYDDVECPCVFKIRDKYYLIGSIREDIKVRYWFSEDLLGEYHSFHSDVLIPKGNYAARVVKDNGHWLIFNFYYMGNSVHIKRVLPPPKQLAVDDDGRLFLKSYYRWDQMVTSTLEQDEFAEPRKLLENPTSDLQILADGWMLHNRSGYELFYLESATPSYIWEGRIRVVGLGKCGLMCDLDEEGNGYFIPFDVVNGFVTIRKWGTNPDNLKEDFVFGDLQSNLFKVRDDLSFDFRLIRYGHYFELSVNGVVRLTLIDYSFHAAGFGLYSASSEIYLSKSTLKSLPEPIVEYSHPESAEGLKD